MEQLSYAEATSRLLEAVPELGEAHRRELQALGSPDAVGSYVVYEDLLARSDQAVRVR